VTRRNCADKHCAHEWCDRNRGTCNRLIPYGRGSAVECGKPSTWKAPYGDPRFPLAYCARHAPHLVAEPQEEERK